MAELKSWGNYPEVKLTSHLFDHKLKGQNFRPNTIPYGNGRSYGDSCLSQNVVELRRHSHFLSFDSEKGILIAQAGVLLEDIISLVLPQGWFLKVVPGTKKITVGGAIASDIHGKNHHLDGCFSEGVNSFKLLMPNDQIINCSRTENQELFHASCGGMGLTGIITEAELNLKKINSSEIKQTTIKTKNLEDTFRIFEEIKSERYSVAWIDCLSKGKQLGKGHVIFGDFGNNGYLHVQNKKKLNIPFFFPSFALNKWSVKAFNFFYYNRIFKTKTTTKISYDNFFFPLDSISNWNKIYGKNGFTQYQFILPLSSSPEGMRKILTAISESGKGSFLAVLKLYGKKNENYLSFPIEGYSLALDFKIEKGLFELLDQLDKIVVEYGGRIYLSKDARVKKDVFEKGYNQLNTFKSVRSKYNLTETINSKQSLRLGI
jgi:decaprenylphospho-beta-D-ribofuranose 2-oxidase